MPHREPTMEGDIHHIFNRGVDKRKIFLNDQDYLRFILSLYILNDSNNKYDIWSNLNFNKQNTLKILSSTTGRSGRSTTGRSGRPVVDEIRKKLVEILAFILMPNHYHLIIRVLSDNGLSKFMQKVGMGYSQYFNKQNQRSGALFEGRYKNVPIKSDEQLNIIFNYVHTNPVELVEPGWKNTGVESKDKAMYQQNTYAWSSYNDYVGKSKFALITDRDFYLDIFGGPNGCRESVENWIEFKAQIANAPEYLKKI